MKIALLGAFPIIPFAKQLGIRNPPQNTTSWNVNLAKGLAEIPGNDVHFISMNSAISKHQEVESDGVKIHFLFCPRKVTLLTLFQYNKINIYRELTKIKPDIVHGHGTEHEYSYIAATSGYPNVITVHNYVPDIIKENKNLKRLKLIIFRVFEKYVFNNSRYIICTTNYLASRVKNETNAKLRVIENSIGSSFFDVEKKATKRHEAIVYVGYFRPEKNIIGLLKAFKLIKRKRKRVVLKLVGTYSKDNTKYYRQMNAFILENNLEQAVKLTGYKEPAAVMEEMASASLLVLPSTHEPFGCVLPEAMATGTPVIASRVGGIPYVVEDGKTGFLVEPGDVDALAEKMILLLEDEDLRRRMGQQGRKAALRRFHPEVVARKTKAVYKEVIETWRA